MTKQSFGSFKYLLFVLLIIAGCSKESQREVEPEPEVVPEKEYFVSSTLISSFTKAQLQATATNLGLDAFKDAILYDVDFYQFIYNTTLNGKDIQASGLLCVPKGMSTAPALLSAQHGTIFSDAEAPSNFPRTYSGFEILASAGYVTLIPDYIGYGVSASVQHPYYDMQSSGLTVVDMIKASKEYLEKENKAINDKLFLLGYSEGGYVTMAAQREIETNADHKLSITAAAEGAGGYDISLMLQKVTGVTSYPDPSFLALFIQSYNTLYGFNRPLTDYFKEPYAARVPQLLDGSRNGTQINGQLTNTPTDLFADAFYGSLTNANAEAAFKAKVAENSFPNWSPKSVTRLYHGTADANVFIETSQSTYDRFRAAGATNVTLIPIPGGTHQTSVFPMVQDALQWFATR
ncbi:alpha/beta fold hydrolase [Mucilaginibacter sp. JRF]|uniref:alpha/beta hydrolase family protein n=1 Tax=Mucilaginibacter sp. JRF TaxID=2780088 RepID=UPI0018810C1F|nr:alpha/beta fold hydrolase [Mucilaginibacter sp. JRF]MBE9585420.1 alpha/beta fold hydrolase [Mucilaginibacter sp. JRF]